MDLTPAQLWIIAGVILFIAEIITPGFVLANFGVGAFAGAIAAWLGADTQVQMIVFAITCLVSFFTVRPLLSKTMLKKGEQTPTGTAAIVGRVAIVTDDIPEPPNAGRVKLDGDSWRAMSDSGAPIKTDTTVTIIRVESTTVIVTPKPQ